MEEFDSKRDENIFAHIFLSQTKRSDYSEIQIVDNVDLDHEIANPNTFLISVKETLARL